MISSNFFSRLIREPLVHFLVLGAALFILYYHVGDDRGERSDRIVVDEVEVLRLTEQFQRTWMRPPSRQELEGLAEEFVKEEILYREALALGLDQDDLVIRRRLSQKMEFLNTDLAAQQTPTEEQLQTYLNSHPDKFLRPAHTSFQQIYLGGGEGTDNVQRKAAALLERLVAEPETVWQELGDPTLLPPALADSSNRHIATIFGNALAESIAGAPLDRWSGPHASAYGQHLVRVTGRTPASLPALTEVRAQVEREWSNERRVQSNEQFYLKLRERYAVEIHLPDDAAGDKLAARQQ